MGEAMLFGSSRNGFNARHTLLVSSVLDSHLVHDLAHAADPAVNRAMPGIATAVRGIYQGADC